LTAVKMAVTKSQLLIQRIRQKLWKQAHSGSADKIERLSMRVNTFAMLEVICTLPLGALEASAGASACVTGWSLNGIRLILR